MENEKTNNYAVKVIQFHIKLGLFQPSKSKTVGEDTFLAAKVPFFKRREKTHQNKKY